MAVFRRNFAVRVVGVVVAALRSKNFLVLGENGEEKLYWRVRLERGALAVCDRNAVPEAVEGSGDLVRRRAAHFEFGRNPSEGDEQRDVGQLFLRGDDEAANTVEALQFVSVAQLASSFDFVEKFVEKFSVLSRSAIKWATDEKTTTTANAATWRRSIRRRR